MSMGRRPGSGEPDLLLPTPTGVVPIKKYSNICNLLYFLYLIKKYPMCNSIIYLYMLSASCLRTLTEFIYNHSVLRIFLGRTAGCRQTDVTLMWSSGCSSRQVALSANFRMKGL